MTGGLTIQHQLCSLNYNLKPAHIVGSSSSTEKPAPPSKASQVNILRPREPSYTSTQPTPSTHTLAKHDAPYILVSDGSRIYRNGKPHSGVAMVPLQNGTYTVNFRPDGKQCSAKTEALGLGCSLHATPLDKEGIGLADNHGIIQTFNKGEPPVTRHKLRMANRTTFMPIWDIMRDRSAHFYALWVVGHSKRIGPVYDAQRNADRLAGISSSSDPPTPDRRFPKGDADFLVYRQDNSLIEDDVRAAVIRAGITRQYHIAKTKSITRLNPDHVSFGQQSKFHDFIDGFKSHLSIDPPTNALISSADKPAIKLLFETRANQLPTKEKLHARDQTNHPDPTCPNCNTKVPETPHHALFSCPAHSRNNAATVSKIVDILLKIPDPLCDIWSLQPPNLQELQEWLDDKWPDRLKVTHSNIPHKQDIPLPDPYAKENFLLHPDDTEVDTALLKKANQPGITKKQDSLEHRPTPKFDTTLTITHTHLPHLHPLKVSRFLELWDTYKELHTPAVPAHFLSDLQSAIADECPTAGAAVRPDTGQQVDHANFWAADRGLTNILTQIGIKVERFSSSLNFNRNFSKSYSARKNDATFSLTFDGLHSRHPTTEFSHLEVSSLTPLAMITTLNMMTT